MRQFLWSVALGLLASLQWAGAADLYRCPGNLYTDTPGVGCTVVQERISNAESAHEQNAAEREGMAKERATLPGRLEPATPELPVSAAPPIQPLEDSDESTTMVRSYGR